MAIDWEEILGADELDDDDERTLGDLYEEAAEAGPHYFECPKEDEAEVKALGAMWDEDRQMWFYADKEDEYKFDKWL